jgi:hypothetical protein
LAAIKTPENTEEDPDEPEPADGGDTQMEYSSDWLHSASIKEQQQNTAHEDFSQYKYGLIS